MTGAPCFRPSTCPARPVVRLAALLRHVSLGASRSPAGRSSEGCSSARLPICAGARPRPSHIRALRVPTSPPAGFGSSCPERASTGPRGPHPSLIRETSRAYRVLVWPRSAPSRGIRPRFVSPALGNPVRLAGSRGPCTPPERGSLPANAGPCPSRSFRTLARAGSPRAQGPPRSSGNTSRLPDMPSRGPGTRIRELPQKLVPRLLERHFLQERVIGVEQDRPRPSRRVESEYLVRLLDANRFPVGPIRPREFHGCRHLEQGHRVLDFLRLLRAQLNLLGRFVPRPGKFELRVPGVVEPLVEEDVEVASGRLLNRLLEIIRFDVLARELLHVLPDRLPPQVVTEFVPHHVQHVRALLVRVAIEHVGWFEELHRDDRPLVILARFLMVAVPVRLELHERGLFAEEVFPPQDLEVRGEGFVQPDVAPRAAGEEITEPLMGELVGEEPFRSIVLVRLLVREAVLGHGRSEEHTS